MNDTEKKVTEETDESAYDCDNCEHFRVCYKIHQYHVLQINTGLYCPSFKRKQSEGEWISVEERLPDGSGKFLVVDEEGYITTATWYPNHGWFMAVCNGTPVTHWMPLPEPPVTKGA